MKANGILTLQRGFTGDFKRAVLPASCSGHLTPGDLGARPRVLSSSPPWLL